MGISCGSHRIWVRNNLVAEPFRNGAIYLSKDGMVRHVHSALERRQNQGNPNKSVPGQTEKNSVRAYVFHFALKLGHCSIPSAAQASLGPRKTRLGATVCFRS